MQKMKLLNSFETHYREMTFDQFGFIVLSKIIENVEIRVIFTLCFKLINDPLVFKKVNSNANASLLVQNVLDCEYLS